MRCAASSKWPARWRSSGPNRTRLRFCPRAIRMSSGWDHDPRSALTFRPGDKVADIDTSATPGFVGDKNGSAALQEERNKRYAGLQEMLYANSREGDHRSVLLVLQGMDTAGKGGIVKHVVGQANPQGIRYTSFGVPTEEEHAHHYLWRIRNALRPAGHSGGVDRAEHEERFTAGRANMV